MAFKEQVEYICELHQNAETLLSQRIHLVSTDEMTGIQALERLFVQKPMQPKRVEPIEFEYIRHGTLSLIAKLASKPRSPSDRSFLTLSLY